MTNTRKGLSRSDLRTLTLSALGAALEFYDFIIFVFFTAAIAALFFPSDMPEWLRVAQTFGIFAAGYLIRPLGGIAMAHFGDLVGRKRMFVLSVMLMTVPTLLIGLLPTYAVIGIWAPILLLLLRMLQGAAVGGEVPGAWVFVAEHVPDRVGLACGALTTGLTAGIVLGSLMASALQTWFGAGAIMEGLWRVPFIIGGALGLLAMWLRRFLQETPVFEQMRRTRQLSTQLPLRRVVTGHRRAVVESMLLTWILTAAIVVIILMLPTLASSVFGIDAAHAQRANTLAAVMLAFGALAYGMAADRFGAVRMVVGGGAALIVAVLVLFHLMATAPAWFLPAYVLTGFLVGVVGAVPVLLIKAYPPQVRYSGVSFSYNVAYAITGGLTPLLVSLWSQRSPMAPAWYVVLAAFVAMLAAVSMRRFREDGGGLARGPGHPSTGSGN